MKRFALCVLLLSWPSNLDAQESKEKSEKTSDPMGHRAGKSLKHWNGAPIVFVANGSGGEMSVSDNLKTVLREQHLSALVIPIRWCRKPSAIQDHLDQEAHYIGASLIVERAKKSRLDCPDSPIFLVGYSAGAHVVLSAAEQLGAGSLERVYLLAPSVSLHYDLTPALRSCRGGICSFWSESDTVLEVVADNWLTAEGLKTACAGRVGFRVPREAEGKHPKLYAKFNQVRWQEGMGGHGGHLSFTRESFLCRYLVPNLFTARGLILGRRTKAQERLFLGFCVSSILP